MPIVAPFSSPYTYPLAVPLARYAQIVDYSEYAFWGIQNPTNDAYQCREIWNKRQRDALARALADSQEEIENEIGYFLSPRWLVGTIAEAPNGWERVVDQQIYTRPLKARWGMVQYPGIRAESDIALATAVDLTADPAIIGPLATAVTDITEIHVYYPGTDFEIDPSSVVIAGGNVTIEIPLPRLVDITKLNNPEIGWPDQASTYQATVDVKRVYTVGSTNAVIVEKHSCSTPCSSEGCTQHTRTACIEVVDYRRGSLRVRPSTYSDGSWSSGITRDCCREGETARLYYYAGLLKLDEQLEQSIIRLAHTKMPRPPCSCKEISKMWEEDRRVPDLMSGAQANCPFGKSDGAYTVWKFIGNHRLGRMGLAY